MKLWYLFFIIILLTPVLASQPTPETQCCMNFEAGYALSEECEQFDLNEEKCKKMVSNYESTLWWINNGTPLISIILLAFIGWLIWFGIKKMRKKSKKK